MNKRKRDENKIKDDEKSLKEEILTPEKVSNNLEYWKEFSSSLNKILKEIKERNEKYLYFDLKESNDLKGEYSHFYFKYDKETSKEFLFYLNKINNILDERDDWIIDRSSIKSKKVKKLINQDNNGYMSSHNCGEYVSLDNIKKMAECSQCHIWLKEDCNFDKEDISFCCIHEKEENKEN